RAHYHSMEVQMDLTRHGIPFQITSGLRFFEQAHVKDVASFLKYVVNPRDEVAFKRMVRLLPGIGARSAEGLWDDAVRGLGAAPNLSLTEPGPGESAAPTAAGPHFGALLLAMKVPPKSRKSWEQLAHTLEEIAPNGVPLVPAEMIACVVEAVYDDYAKSKFPNYDQRREDLNTLANFARDYESAAEFLDQLALLSGLDNETVAPDDDAEKVTLSSIHQAKGLEWKAVFIIWLSDGMFPSSRSVESESALEEERRLFYVAVTRAKDELYLSYPHLRLNAGYGEMLQHPSRFLGEIPKALLEEWQISGGY
ncbi:MAG TPA: ATP-dependent helicase, partial [Chthoniobacteraceae bacterium]